MADVLFTNYAFPATGTSTNRTMPDRLNEVVNVKDYGALGDSTGSGDGQDDTDYIQAAADAAMSRNAVLYFPKGIYRITESVTFDDDSLGAGHIDIQGNGAVIAGSFNGFLFSRGNQAFGNQLTNGIRRVSGMRFVNGHTTGGCLQWDANIGAHVSDCYFDGNRGLTLEFNQSSKVSSCTFRLGQGRDMYVDSVGISAGDNVIIEACDITDHATAIQIAGVGPIVRACRLETCNVGIKVGYDTTGIRACSGFKIEGGSYESCGVAIELINAGRFYIGNFNIIGFPGATQWNLTEVASTTITGSDSGATATAVITEAGIMTLTGTSGGPFDNFEEFTGVGVPTGSFFFEQKSGTPGGNGEYSVKSTPRYGIYGHADAVSQGLFCGISCGVAATNYGIYLAGDSAARTGIVFAGVGAANSSPYGGQAWGLPAYADNCEFINCNVSPTYTFAGLPSGTSEGVPNAREGDRYRITDGASGKVWGDPVTAGGGSTHYTVEYDGTNWRVVGK